MEATGVGKTVVRPVGVEPAGVVAGVVVVAFVEDVAGAVVLVLVVLVEVFVVLVEVFVVVTAAVVEAVPWTH